MKQIAYLALACLSLLTACSKDTTTTPSTAPAKPATTPPAKPAATEPAAKPPAEPIAKPVPEPVVEPAAKPPSEPVANPPADPAETPKPAATADMDADIASLMAKPEQPDESITIQHILISFQGAPRMPPSVTRSKEEAKALAEKVYAEVVAGGDFDALVRQYTNDRPPGIYPLTQASRKGMVKGFGDVGFRLKVGEVGVAPWDAAASPYGWHIIKRLK